MLQIQAVPVVGARLRLLAPVALPLRPHKPHRVSTMTAAVASTVPKEFEKLSEKLKEVQALSGISGLLGWDEMVMMPEGAAASRGSQKATLAGVLHERSSDPEIGALLKHLEAYELDGKSADPYRKAAIREARREYKKVTSITKDLAKREAEHESHAYQVWVQARQAKDFKLFAPVLEKWVALRRERAALIAPDRPAYDVLLDDYQPGLTAARLEGIFTQVKQGLVPLLADIRSRGQGPDASWLSGEDFDPEAQASLCRQIALDLGFDLSNGRLDVSVHPFTGGAHPTDVRMTTRYKRDSLLEGISGTVHETGHALYEQGRNLEYDGLPVNEAAGMAVHESQSLLWERMVGLGRPFAKYLLPKLQEAFPQLDKSKTPEDLYQGENLVLPKSLIRVEADEVTYPLHIILRYELESALVKGDIEVADLPALWNQKMKEYLGVEPEDDAQGILQDVHWSYGLFGYFPTYSLGAMTATQIYQTAVTELPEFEAAAEKGEFASLKSWLNQHVHKVGRLYPTVDDLLVKITGKPLDPQIFLDYLTAKYTELYHL